VDKTVLKYSINCLKNKERGFNQSTTGKKTVSKKCDTQVPINARIGELEGWAKKRRWGDLCSPRVGEDDIGRTLPTQ